MLGWEYPPHIAGGLGTACAGLTTALAAQGVSIHFIVPEMFGDEEVYHMRLSGATSGGPVDRGELSHFERTGIGTRLMPYLGQRSFERVYGHHAYGGASGDADNAGEASGVSSSLGADSELPIAAHAALDGERSRTARTRIRRNMQEDNESAVRPASRYSSSLFAEVERFTSDVLAVCAVEEFDLIHAHDWMTFPAGVALAQRTKRPLVVHVHSLEHDRSGVFYDEGINALERFGMRAADRVIAVSHYTKRSIQRYHEIAEDKISVVHNGVYPRHLVSDYRERKTWPKHVVLFLGRVTFQKGPEYFVEVAKRVIPHVPDLLFVLAGDGDLLPKIREQVAQLGLSEYFRFPGFVQGEELEELFSVADLYVMPSVSEPFGIAALEAISYETPVVLSKQSGVSEVIQHALKVDFWDTRRMADRIINALMHEELRQELSEQAMHELAQLHWEAAALKTRDVYHQVCRG